MTQYHGGKFRHGQEIAQAIARNIGPYSFQSYVEPFVGMGGVLRHIPAVINVPEYLASDINESLILMWQQLQAGWVPPVTVTEELYNDLKATRFTSPSALHAYVGFSRGFSGIYFRGNLKKMDVPIDSILSTTDLVSNVIFSHGEYNRSYSNAIIYCDPPYRDTSTEYRQTDGTNSFDHAAFYNWCIEQSLRNIVFISEYSQPDLPCRLIWTSDKTQTIRGRATAHEKLYLVL
jgi:DNA adenine methylase